MTIASPFTSPARPRPSTAQPFSGALPTARDSITRIYLGPDFIVRETLFVPLNEPGAILTYSVQSARPLSIDVHAVPILNLMWPAGIGGQSTTWNPSLSAFILSEPSSGYTAIVGSPDIIAHDDLGNRTTQGANGPSLGFTLRPSTSGTTSVAIALNAPGAANPSALFQSLITQRETLSREYDQHVSDTINSMIAITTPDEQVNQAIAWSQLALDQAWVCNPDLGCGYVAGYGPTRGARRPQYDWFFAGDGLIAADASATAGNISQAREELAFILRYQDKKTGMIWHELSQSAAFLDWVGEVPLHVRPRRHHLPIPRHPRPLRRNHRRHPIRPRPLVGHRRCLSLLRIRHRSRNSFAAHSAEQRRRRRAGSPLRRPRPLDKLGRSNRRLPSTRNA